MAFEISRTRLEILASPLAIAQEFNRKQKGRPFPDGLLEHEAGDLGLPAVKSQRRRRRFWPRPISFARRERASA